MRADEDGTKRCSKCRQAKQVSEFGRDRRWIDGLRSECKNCTNSDKARYNRTASGRATKARRYARFPEKPRAHKAVARCIKNGLMPRADSLKCSRCANKAEHYHHAKGYSQAHVLDVEPLCRSCHSISHQPAKATA